MVGCGVIRRHRRPGRSTWLRNQADPFRAPADQGLPFWIAHDQVCVAQLAHAAGVVGGKCDRTTVRTEAMS